MSMKKLDYYFYKNWIFVNLFNIISFSWERNKLNKIIRGVFIPLQLKYSFTKNYCPFMFSSMYGKLLSISIHNEVKWKDKYYTPRYEENPFISIGLFNKYFFNWTWKLPPHIESCWIDNDDYWEQALWYAYYCNKDIKKAKETWPWTGEDNKTTWNDKFLTNKIKNEIYNGDLA